MIDSSPAVAGLRRAGRWCRRVGGGPGFADRRPALFGQAAVFTFFVLFYDNLRNLAPRRVALASRHAGDVQSLERRLHLAAELPMNHWLAGRAGLGLAAGDWYDIAHFVVTLPLILIAWWCLRPAAFRSLRNLFVLINVIGFAAYWWYPLAPPRLLANGGFVDIVERTHAIGGWSAVLSNASYEYGAMPSLHVAWALWSAMAIFMLTSRRWIRTLAVVYPGVTTAVVLATGNHWVFDAAAGAGCFLLSVMVLELAARYRRRDRRSNGPDDRGCDEEGIETVDRPRPARVLVISASVGAGHDGAAAELADRLRRDGRAVVVRDYLPALPIRLGFFMRWLYFMQLRHAPTSYEWHYAKMRTSRLMMAVTRGFGNLAQRRVRRMLRTSRADVVVSTYPLASQTLGRLRARGRLAIPSVTFVTDFSVHPAIVSSYVDLNLCITPAAAVEATRLCGRPAFATGPLVTRAVRKNVPNERESVRAELGLPVAQSMVLIVAGSWGVGNVAGAAERLAADPQIAPVVACGHNETLRAELSQIPKVTALGWRRDMPRLLRASDVVVENAGGLTAMEAMAVGVPVISYETIPGHGVHNATEMESAGVSTWVRHPDDLLPTVKALSLRDASQEQRDRAQSLFIADAAVVVGELAEHGDIGRALVTAGITPTSSLSLAKPNRALRVRHRIMAAATVVCTLAYLGTAGVEFATDRGVDTVRASRHSHDLYVVASLTPADLQSASLLATVKSLGVTAAIDRNTVMSSPTRLAALRQDGIPVADADSGQAGWATPAQSYRELVTTGNDIDRADGQRARLFVSRQRISAVTLATAYFAGERLVRPTILRAANPSIGQLHGGEFVWVAGQTVTPNQMNLILQRLAETAQSDGLVMSSLSEIGERA